MKYSNLERWDFNAPLMSAIQQKLGIILVSEGVKPACDIQINSTYPSKGVSQQELDAARKSLGLGPYPGVSSVPEIIRDEFLIAKRVQMGNLCGPLGEEPLISGSEKENLEKILADLGLEYNAESNDYTPNAIARRDESGNLIKVPLAHINFLIAKKRSDLNQLVAVAGDHDSDKKIDSQRIRGRLFGYPVSAVEAYINGSSLNRVSSIDLGDYELFKLFDFSRRDHPDEIETVLGWGKIIERVSPTMFEKAKAAAEYLRNIRRSS